MNIAEFKALLTRTTINEVSGSLGSAEYKIPDDDKTLISDFYTMWELSTTLCKNQKCSKELKFDVEYAFKELCYFLKDRLLKFGYYAIIREGRHCFGNIDADNNRYQTYASQIAELMRQAGIAQHDIKQLYEFSADSYIDRDEVFNKFQDSSPVDIVRGLRKMFDRDDWMDSYGGKAWVMCCNSWLNLYNARSVQVSQNSGELSIPNSIDLLYSAEHNTGSFLNKNVEYRGKWVKGLLDLKFKSNNIRDIAYSSSNYVKSLIKKFNYVADEFKDSNFEISPKSTFEYALNVIGGRFIQGEKLITQDPESAYSYFVYILRDLGWDRWPAAEDTIKTSPEWAYYYATDVIGSRWPEAEPAIAKDANFATKYIMRFRYDYAEPFRWIKAEPAMSTNPESAYMYAKYCLQGRWKGKYSKRAENIIIQDPYYAAHYALEFIGGRWPEAESSIITEPDTAINYAADVLKRRWPELESTIINTNYAYYYAKIVIGDRWPEAEHTLLNDRKYLIFLRSLGYSTDNIDDIKKKPKNDKQDDDRQDDEPYEETW